MMNENDIKCIKEALPRLLAYRQVCSANFEKMESVSKEITNAWNNDKEVFILVCIYVLGKLDFLHGQISLKVLTELSNTLTESTIIEYRKRKAENN